MKRLMNYLLDNIYELKNRLEKSEFVLHQCRQELTETKARLQAQETLNKELTASINKKATP